MPKSPPPSRSELLDYAFIVGMRFRWHYRGYESEEKARAALRRRFPGLGCSRYARALQKAINLYDRTWEVINRNLLAFKELRLTSAWVVPRKIINQLKQKAPGFRLSTYSQAVCWVFYWDYLR